MSEYIPTPDHGELQGLDSAPVLSYLDTKFEHDVEDFGNYCEIGCRFTGFWNIDKLNMIYPGLYVIGAVPSAGKTTFAGQIADYLAKNVEKGAPVLFFSFEQSRFELVSKSLARLTAMQKAGMWRGEFKPELLAKYKNFDDVLTALQVRKGTKGVLVGKNDKGKDIYTIDEAKEAYREIAGRESLIECNFDTTFADIKATIHSYLRANPNGEKPVVFIDYLQAIAKPLSKRLTDKEAVDENMRALKNLQRNEGLSIFVISTLNRANYLTPVDYESFKESGAIEYTADVIWGLQLACMSNDKSFIEEKQIAKKRDLVRKGNDANPRKVELLILKNRYGRKGNSVYFDYYAPYDYFVPTEAADSKERVY